MKSVRIRSFSGPYFPAFLLRIQSECWKIRTRKASRTDTFHAVTMILLKAKKKKKEKKDCVLHEPQELRTLVILSH